MAKGSPFMGTLRGKIGETVALRRNGQQVLRAYVSDVKNPNSQKQQVQRMVQATAAQGYSAMKQITDHSFEGVQVGQKSMSYFMSQNMKMLRNSIVANPDGSLVSASVNFTPKGVNSPALAPFIVGKGTLPEVPYCLLGDASNDVSLRNFVPIMSVGNGVTVREAHSLFCRANAAEVGDWFTFMVLYRPGESPAYSRAVRFGYVRFVVSADADDNGVESLVLSPSLTSEGIPADTWLEGSLVTTFVPNGGNFLAIDFSNFINGIENANVNTAVVAVSCIHSRQNVGGSWQRSNAVMTLRSDINALNIPADTNWADALATYAGQAEAKGIGDHVLNGGR